MNKKYFIVNFIAILIIALFYFLISNVINNSYKQKIIDNESYLIGNLLNKYPNLKEDIISSYLIKDNYEIGNNLINEYNLITIKNNNIIILIYCLISALLLFIINFIYIKSIYKKIAKIDKYMNNILNDDYSINIKDYCEGDISNLKNDIYKMTIKLKEQSELLIKEKKYLEETLQDISHQIKTPLTSMYMINDILTNEKDENIKKEFLIKNKNQIERIEWLVTSLLKLSRLESGTVKLKKEKINLKELVDKSIEPINVLLELRNIKLTKNIIDVNLVVDINWTVEALLNVIKNACEHTVDKIEIVGSTNPLYTEIKIIDNGSGISKKDIKHIFERFYKGNHNKESIGIGLNMSKKIINLQNGLIEVESKEGVGSTFIIKLYKNNL
ncbi:MAG TPA: HAMP domain-containing histidine kinase [Candidatus Faecisoma merdavium]|nr:HAMP domain-containing histidine kinase [Candidatus Faecisoma merdavium]